MKHSHIISLLAAAALFTGCSSHSTSSSESPYSPNATAAGSTYSVPGASSSSANSYTAPAGGQTVNNALPTTQSSTARPVNYSQGSTTNQNGQVHAKTAYQGSTGPGLLMERYKSGNIEGLRK